MILVVDSGSYKSDWMFHPEGGEVLNIRSKGINPIFTSEKEIIKIVQHIKGLKPYFDQIDEIYFFGSGCTNPDRREIVSNALSTVFPNTFISVDSDVIGSAYATCGNDEGFIATIGTGSNISFFDGEFVQPTKQGLGYILGDIGSGAWFGIKLITSFLYESLPKELYDDFAVKYALNKETVMENVYQKPNPTVYLSSFAPFLSEHKNHPFISALIDKGFEEFVQSNICLYSNYHEHTCHFVGSIAYYFNEELIKVCKRYQIKVGKIIKQPIQDLYHFVLEREKLQNSIN
jgi:N-acetylglucosamine kinase-like BadF-type ATPase